MNQPPDSSRPLSHLITEEVARVWQEETGCDYSHLVGRYMYVDGYSDPEGPDVLPIIGLEETLQRIR